MGFLECDINLLFKNFNIYNHTNLTLIISLLYTSDNPSNFYYLSSSKV